MAYRYDLLLFELSIYHAIFAQGCNCPQQWREAWFELREGQKSSRKPSFDKNSVLPSLRSLALDTLLPLSAGANLSTVTPAYTISHTYYVFCFDLGSCWYRWGYLFGEPFLGRSWHGLKASVEVSEKAVMYNPRHHLRHYQLSMSSSTTSLLNIIIHINHNHHRHAWASNTLQSHSNYRPIQHPYTHIHTHIHTQSYGIRGRRPDGRWQGRWPLQLRRRRK